MHTQAGQLQAMLHAHYSRHKGLVGFIDESYRTGREGEFPFYTVTSTILDVEDLTEIRKDYINTVGSAHWHTTERFNHGDEQTIREFLQLLSSHKSELVISVQVHIEDGDIEHARRECLVQTVSRLSNMGCNLVIYERREDNKARNSDAALFSRASRDGFIPRNLRLFPGSPSAESLLWGPDLVGWAMRRYVAVKEIEWVLPLISNCQVIDASPGKLLRKKGPQPAAAKGYGPDSSVDLKGEGKNRSSGNSITRFARADAKIFDVFPKISNPVHEPSLLSAWLVKEFPNKM